MGTSVFVITPFVLQFCGSPSLNFDKEVDD